MPVLWVANAVDISQSFSISRQCCIDSSRCCSKAPDTFENSGRKFIGITSSNKTEKNLNFALLKILVCYCFQVASENGAGGSPRRERQKADGGDHGGAVPEKSLPFHEEARHPDREDPQSGLQAK